MLNFLLPEIFDDLDVFTSWFRLEELQGSDADNKIVELERKENVLSMLHQVRYKVEINCSRVVLTFWFVRRFCRRFSYDD